MSIKCKTWSLGVREPLSRMIGVLPKNKSMTYILTHHPDAGLYLANRCRVPDRTRQEIAHYRWMLKNQAFMNKNFPRGTRALVDYDGDRYHAWILGFKNGKVRVRWCDEDFVHRVSNSENEKAEGIYCKDECVSFSKVFFLKGKRMNIEEFDEASSESDEEVNHNFRPRKTRKRNYDDMDDFIVDDEDDDEFFDESDDEEDYDEQDGDDEQDEIVSDVNTGKNVEDDKVEKLWKLYQSGRITKDMYENYLKRVLDKMVDEQ